MKAILAVLCGLLVACASSVSPSSPVPTQHLVGKWYQGDGTGYNVVLTLRRDSSYDAIWAGCGGIYGTARGNWRLAQTKLILTPSEEQDMMRKHLRTLDVLPDKRGFILVRSEDRKDFNRWGSEDSLWCFKPTK